jgi:hypothetical protein
MVWSTLCAHGSPRRLPYHRGCWDPAGTSSPRCCPGVPSLFLHIRAAATGGGSPCAHVFLRIPAVLRHQAHAGPARAHPVHRPRQGHRPGRPPQPGRPPACSRERWPGQPPNAPRSLSRCAASAACWPTRPLSPQHLAPLTRPARLPARHHSTPAQPEKPGKRPPEPITGGTSAWLDGSPRGTCPAGVVCRSGRGYTPVGH